MTLYGAGGHAKVVRDILKECGEKEIYFYDDFEGAALEGCIRILDVAQIKDGLIISIGTNSTRKKVADKLNCAFGRAIHNFSSISKSASVDKGTVVMAGAVINADSKIGAHCIVNTRTSVDHDCVLDEFVHLSPGAVLCGGVQVGQGSWIGAGAVVIPSIRIGKWAVIGAGAVVIDDVPDFAVVVGNPGRITRYQKDQF